MNTAPATGTTLVIARNVPLTQVTDYTPNDPFPAETHEQALDKLTMEVQQINEAINRSIKLSLSNTMTSTEFTVGASERANKVFGFDSAGELVVSQEMGTYRGNWSSGTAYKQRDIIKDTSNANIYICLTAHTASGSQPISSNTDSAKWALIVDAASATAAQAAAEAAQAAAEAAQTAAELAETNAETAETNAETAETNAETAAATATTQAGIATTKAAEAATSASDANTAKLAAQTAKTAAELAETNAETAETNAETAQAAAELAETNAETAAATATTQAGIATTQAGLAATAKTNAETAETNSETAATNSANSATDSANSATASAASAVSAASSAASAAALLDNFDDRYLGAKTSDPSVDNDGNALAVGALYFNTTDGVMKVYTASGWIAASSASVATLATFEFVATSGQTVFTGADANSATLSYVAPAIIVTLNGVRLRPGDDYTATNGTSITLASAAALNDELVVDAFGSFLVANTYTISEADALLATKAADSAVVKLTGTQTIAGTKTFSTDPIMGVSALTGTLAKARMPSGSVLQVVSVNDTNQYVFNSGSMNQYTYYDVTSLTASITPTSSSSKILVLIEICASQANNVYTAFFRAQRNGTTIGVGVNGSYGGTGTSGMRTSDGGEIGTVSINYLDSPATTSSTTYKVQVCNSGGSSYPSFVNRPANSSTGWEQSGASTITLMEIAG